MYGLEDAAPTLYLDNNVPCETTLFAFCFQHKLRRSTLRHAFADFRRVLFTPSIPSGVLNGQGSREHAAELAQALLKAGTRMHVPFPAPLPRTTACTRCCKKLIDARKKTVNLIPAARAVSQAIREQIYGGSVVQSISDAAAVALKEALEEAAQFDVSFQNNRLYSSIKYDANNEVASSSSLAAAANLSEQ